MCASKGGIGNASSAINQMSRAKCTIRMVEESIVARRPLGLQYVLSAADLAMQSLSMPVPSQERLALHELSHSMSYFILFYIGSVLFDWAALSQLNPNPRKLPGRAFSPMT